MGWIGETVDSIKSIQIRQVLNQAVSLGLEGKEPLSGRSKVSPGVSGSKLDSASFTAVEGVLSSFAGAVKKAREISDARVE